MSSGLFTKPSLLGLYATGIMFLYVLYLLYTLGKSRERLSQYQTIVVVLLISLLIGVHSLLHMGAEYIYNFNPLECKYID